VGTENVSHPVIGNRHKFRTIVAWNGFPPNEKKRWSHTRDPRDAVGEGEEKDLGIRPNGRL